MKQTWLTMIIHRPWLTLLLGILVIFGTGFGAQNLYFRGDYKIFFEENNSQLLAFEQMQDVFNKTSSASIIIAPKSGDVFDKETLQLIHELTEQAWQTPYSTRVDSLSNYQHTWAEDDDLLVEAMIYDDTELTDEKIQSIKSAVMSEPNLVKRMVSEKGHVALINITVQLPEKNRTAEISEVAEHVRALSAKFKANGAKADFYHAGIIVMNHSFASEAKKDASTLVPAMFLGILIMLAILLRSIASTLVTMLIIITSVVTTLGIAGWAGFFLSTATVNVPTIIMTLAVADCVHVIGSMLYAMRQGKTKEEAITESMKLNLMPIFITSITTAIGFLTMNFSNVPILRDLGNLTAIGVMVAFAFSVTLLPAMLRLAPIKVTAEKQTSGRMEWFAEWVIAKHRMLLPVSLFVVVGLSSFVVLNQVNDVATKYFAKNTEFRQSTDFMAENLSGMANMDFALYTGKESGINDPKFLALVEKFTKWLESRPEVDHVSTITNTFKRLNQNMHGDDPSWYKLPEEQALAAQYLLMYEMSLPYGLDLNNQIDLNKSTLRVVTTLRDLGSKEFTAFEQEAIQWFQDNAPHIVMNPASPSLMFAHIGEQNMQSMLKSLPTALILISLLLIFALKSLRLGIISLVPNVVPATVGFGIWGIFSGEINLGLSVVASMSLGIIVDDTVHFLSKYKHARELGKNAEEAVRYSFHSVGRALWITTLVLSVGFAVLAMSSFRLNSDMGMLTGLILIVALAVDFLFLPAFLMVFDKDKEGTLQNEHASAQ
ncbi:MAG: MMPL family transporter [Algicola sp.]|nr:MMPL family transporter [Algicola sp.]